MRDKHKVSVVVDGITLVGTYYVEDEIVTVTALQRTKSTQLGGSSAIPLRA